jgi:CubicO group peptidase (beta-lactamase class C family)
VTDQRRVVLRSTGMVSLCAMGCPTLRCRFSAVDPGSRWYAYAAGGAISTAGDLAIWMRALVGGKLLDANYQRQWLDSLEPQDPSKPLGQKYGYGISQITFGPNSMYFHGGEMPGYNSFMGHDPANDVTLIIWTSLTISLDGRPTANAIMLKMLDQIYTASPPR